MFKVSFNCSNSALPEVLASLDGKVSVRVMQCADAGEVLINKGKTAAAIAKSAKARSQRKAERLSGRANGEASKKDQALELVRSVGLQPFRAGEIVARGALKGIPKPAIYQAIYAEMALGNLRKVSFGEYQKTGSGALEAVNS